MPFPFQIHLHCPLYKNLLWKQEIELYNSFSTVGVQATSSHLTSRSPGLPERLSESRSTTPEHRQRVRQSWLRSKGSDPARQSTQRPLKPTEACGRVWKPDWPVTYERGCPSVYTSVCAKWCHLSVTGSFTASIQKADVGWKPSAKYLKFLLLERNIKKTEEK